jgi:hypothetical protein
VVRRALEEAAARGVQVRLAYNLDHDKPIAIPPPPSTRPELIESLRLPTCGIPGIPDLMHHKYVVRDGDGVLDRLDQLDRGLLDAPGERHPDRALAGAGGGL